MSPDAGAPHAHMAVCLRLTLAIGDTRTVEDIYATALDALSDGLGVSRASILLFDDDGVMRFKAYRRLSDAYRRAVEGHTPWRPDTPHPAPIVVRDVADDPALTPYLATIRAEGIAAMAFIPLVSLGRVIGKFMLYHDVAREPSPEEMQLATLIASQVAFAVERTRAEALARRNEARLRFALDAAAMGTWDWDLQTQRVTWSDNLERLHGLPAGTFDGTFSSYAREIHPEDRDRVLASAQRAIREGVPHEVEYRIVSSDGTVRWVEGKGTVEYEHGLPTRMTGVCVIVTRRKEAELARLAAAEEASRLKDEFLATLSHELRTPLNAIHGWAEMLRSEGLNAERRQQAIDVIARNARLQAQLVEDILDISRVVAGKLDVEFLTVFLPPLIDAVVSGALPAARAHDIRLTSSVPDDLPPITGDPKRLHQVLSNLVSNALKFTPDGGRVEIACALDGTRVRIEVSDTGIGIAPDFLPHVFERFRQADSRSIRRHGGLGLGLAIARHIVEQHHGQIHASSDGVGRGTRVVVALPATLGMGRTSGRHPASVGVVRPLLGGTTVVVVDDQDDSRDLVAVLFEECGARVVRCECVEAALRALDDAPVGLLVADIAMPGRDGLDLIRTVRQRDVRVPAVAVSAYARPEDRQQALASGFNAYCAKPIDASLLLDTAAQLLRPPLSAGLPSST